MPCQQCGAPEAAGLCGVCREKVAAEHLVGEAGVLAAVGVGCDEPDDVGLTATMGAMGEASARSRIQEACTQAAAHGGTKLMIAVAGRLAAESVVHEYRGIALKTLSWSPEARAEGQRTYAAEMRRQHLHPSSEAANLAAEHAADEARVRVVEHLLVTRGRVWQEPCVVTEGPDCREDAYARGAAQARTAKSAARPAGSWRCADCRNACIGAPLSTGRCAPCDGRSRGLSRIERFAQLADRAGHAELTA
ncbi:hypothetical protein HEK616_84200 (plasmid) [Streptomyces nigrescens]|uniref:Uncharacterized protein n=1 Tax=Streptomyces nigrescens TaxID=1920 RepID=A0ABM8A8E4_STRNI|nr:hypothetical protein HEK616_84200 [Streptomyces nigrescens]